MIKKKYFYPVVLLLGIAAFQFITMPDFFYPGDNVAIRAETANWVNTGELGIDYSQRKILGGFLEERGQYLFENDAKQKFFSRYGFGDTVFFVPPYLLYKALYGPVPLMETPRELLFVLNCYAVFFTAVSGFLLYSIASLLTTKYWIRSLFVLASIYATFCCHYLKQPLHENFQICLSLAFFYFSLRFFLHEEEKSPWWNIGIASSAVGLLVTMKSSFVLFYGALGLTLVIDEFYRCGKNLPSALWKPMGKYILWLGLPAIIALACLLASNAIRFGSPLNSGYGQWIQNGTEHDHFTLSLLKTTVPAFLWKKGNANVFLHYPLFIFAIPGFFLLYRKSKSVFWFLTASMLSYFTAICSYSGWSGEWCYGPRHLIFILMGGSVPAICLLEKITALKAGAKWPALFVTVSVLSCSAWNNFQINAIQCFAYNHLSSIFNSLKVPAVSAYFEDYYTRGRIYRDIKLHADRKKEFPPLTTIRYLPGSNTMRVYSQLDQYVKWFGRPNYFFSLKNSEGR